MRKVMLVLCFCMVATFYAQDKNKFVFGGIVSVDLGRFNDRFEIIPTVHRKIVAKTYFGIGATFAYYQQETIEHLPPNQHSEIRITTTKTNTIYYGCNIFLRYYPFEKKKNFSRGLYIHNELEFLRGNGKYQNNTNSSTFTINNRTIFTGIGYKQSLGARVALNMSLLIKLNHEKDSPYNNPIIRIGVEF